MIKLNLILRNIFNSFSFLIIDYYADAVDKMLEQLLNIENGLISKDKAEQNLGDLLADNFLYKK